MAKKHRTGNGLGQSSSSIGGGRGPNRPLSIGRRRTSLADTAPDAGLEVVTPADLLITRQTLTREKALAGLHRVKLGDCKAGDVVFINGAACTVFQFGGGMVWVKPLAHGAKPIEMSGDTEVRLIRRTRGGNDISKDRDPSNAEFRPDGADKAGVIEVGPNGEKLIDDTFGGIQDDFRANLERSSEGVERFVGPRQTNDI